MKNLILSLSLFASLPATAQQNELVLSPAYVRFRAHKQTQKHIGHLPDIHGGGYQLGLTYLRNISWLQIGGGFEVGKLNTVENNITYNSLRRHTVADPYAIFNVLVNGRLRINKWTFSGGLCGGYMIASAHDSYNFGNDWQDYGKYTVGGIYKGGQIGASYQLRPKLDISANFTARFANRQRAGLDTNNNFHNPPYNRLHMYNFGLGIRYRF